jgi:hypothetical protein
MQGELLFIRRCEQMVLLLQSKDEAEILDLAGYLRQMFLDRHQLAATANIKKRKLQFHVGISRFPPNDPYENMTFWSLLDGLDPDTREPGAPSAYLTRDAFLKHVVINNWGKKISIKDIILHAAEAAGGVHHEPTPRNTPIGIASRKILVYGFPIDVYHLKSITRIALRALQTIIDDVQKRQSALQIGASVPSLDKSSQQEPQ